MMKTFIFIALVFLAVVCAKKQKKTPNLSPAENSGNGGYNFRSLNELREHLGYSDDFSFQVEGSRKSSSGVERFRLRQLFQGVPIRVATLQASVNCNGFYTGAVSGFCPTIPSGFDTSVKNSKKQLKKALAKYINANDNEIPGSAVEVSELQLFTSEKNIHIDLNTGSPSVVYYVSALVERGLDDGAYIRYPRVLFTAGNLDVISAILHVKRDGKDRKQSTCPKAVGGNNKLCGNTYGPRCGEVCLNTSFRKGKCVLANDDINVKTVGNSWKREQAKLVTFDCNKPLNDKSNGAFSPAADAFYYAQVFYDVLKNWGRVERTNREPHTLYVHFGNGYPNSFWDGQSTTFGDGTEKVFPFAISEIIGHEMCHAVTDSFGNLVFDSESESVNEAFSDICGKAISYYLDGEAAGWDFANGLMKGSKKSLRYFDDPTRDLYTIASLNDYVPQSDGYMGLGIFTKAFYSIVAQEGIRFRDAFEAFVFANQIYWNEETTFIDGACGIIRAASDLGLDVNKFVNGFNAVAIDVSASECSLAGTEDHIVYCGQNSFDGETRYAEVNSYRKARYTVRPSAGHTNIRITISECGSSSVIMECDGQTSSSRSAVFPINQGVTIVLSANSEDLISLKAVFEFE